MKQKEILDSVRLFELMPGKLIPVALLKSMLPTTEAALFFAKVYDLDYAKVSTLLVELFNTSDVIQELLCGDHSTQLQDYIVGIVEDGLLIDDYDTQFIDAPPPAEVLPEVWKMAEVTVAQSIKDVAQQLSGTLHMMPSKQGQMVFQTMAKMNAQRPTIGVHKAAIQHQPLPDSLVILDVSGSMSEPTVQNIINEVVALSYEANATLAIVSDHCFWWEPGTYDVQSVLDRAEYWGTHYETLAPLFIDRDWGTVITIADYDSSVSAGDSLKRRCNSKVGTVLDMSLVNRPTYLGECIAQFADELRPLLIGTGRWVLQ